MGFSLELIVICGCSGGISLHFFKVGFVLVGEMLAK